MGCVIWIIKFIVMIAGLWFIAYCISYSKTRAKKLKKLKLERKKIKQGFCPLCDGKIEIVNIKRSHKDYGNITEIMATPRCVDCGKDFRFMEKVIGTEVCESDDYNNYDYRPGGIGSV